MKILHIAPFNVANVPLTFVQAERKLGYESHLITFSSNPQRFPEDICLDLPLIRPALLNFLKRFKGRSQRVSHIAQIPESIPLLWSANNIWEKSFFAIREELWRNMVERAYQKYQFEKYDVIQLDGGLDFFRDARIVQRLKKLQKFILCCYTGSDLRIRGVIPAIDRMADLNITVEFDHLRFHPNIHHVFFPFDYTKFEWKIRKSQQQLKIGHAPTNRQAKGSDIIIPIVKALENHFPVKLLLIENLTFDEAIRRKAECDIFIDQIGDLGYGINSLEALAMGIPTCTCLAPGFAERHSDHPFIAIDQHNLKEKLIALINDPARRRQLAVYGREWMTKYHDAVKVVSQIHRLVANASNQLSEDSNGI